MLLKGLQIKVQMCLHNPAAEVVRHFSAVQVRTWTGWTSKRVHSIWSKSPRSDRESIFNSITPFSVPRLLAHREIYCCKRREEVRMMSSLLLCMKRVLLMYTWHCLRIFIFPYSLYNYYKPSHCKCLYEQYCIGYTQI